VTRAEVQALPPTARALAWGPLVLVTLAMLAVATVVRVLGERPGAVPVLAVAALAAAVVAASGDPASRLLAAVPVSALVRRGLRLLLAVLPALAAYAAVEEVLPGPSADLAGPFAALVLTGLAAVTWAPEQIDAHLLALVPVAWVLLDLFLGGGRSAVADALGWWRTEALAVSVLAVAAVLLGRHR
jgi:hypothetical protein